MDEIVVSEYRKKDKELTVELLQKTFPGTSDNETFSWRFESQGKYPPLMICAKHGDKIVSFNSWIPWEFKHNNKTFLGYQSGESATEKEYRRKGIFGRILEYADKLAHDRNIDFLFGFPSSMSFGAFEKAGYRRIGGFNYYFRIVNPFKRTLGINLSRNVEKMPSNMLVELNKITPLNHSDYLEWRYKKNPKSYEIVKYAEKSDEAIFVFKRGKYYNKKYKIGVAEIFMLDANFTNLDEKFIANAFDYIDRVYSRKVIQVRTFFNEKTNRCRAMRRNFHLKINSSEILVLKYINENMDYNVFNRLNNWDLLPHVMDES